MSVNSYRDLRVWLISMNVVEQVYNLTRNFPKQETYGLSSQMQRAAVSIPSNIAEGSARETTPNFLRFLAIALGSLAELETQLILAERLAYTDDQTLQNILSKTDEVNRMLRGLQRSLKAKL